ncbi:hypothetical protein AX15_002690 [Amanita polypyramis BW_CC]|nr:hypothetical protein AX15_002690 [Amanita polypyramis BW_CC]
MIIAPPSEYTGGNIRQCTTVFAWYSDVFHGVKPGYRLALSYNLMHSFSGDTSPLKASDVDEVATAKFRSTLQMWTSVPDEQKSERYMVGLLLHHRYSQLDLKKGIAGLKGEDAHKVSQIRAVAEELGYKLWLANYDRYVEGDGPSVDDTGYRRSSNDPDMIYIYDEKGTLDYIVDLEGSLVADEGKMKLNVAELIPGDLFEHEGPDEDKFEPIMGNCGIVKAMVPSYCSYHFPPG